MDHLTYRHDAVHDLSRQTPRGYFQVVKGIDVIVLLRSIASWHTLSSCRQADVASWHRLSSDGRMVTGRKDSNDGPSAQRRGRADLLDGA